MTTAITTTPLERPAGHAPAEPAPAAPTAHWTARAVSSCTFLVCGVAAAILALECASVATSSALDIATLGLAIPYLILPGFLCVAAALLTRAASARRARRGFAVAAAVGTVATTALTAAFTFGAGVVLTFAPAFLDTNAHFG